MNNNRQSQLLLNSGVLFVLPKRSNYLQRLPQPHNLEQFNRPFSIYFCYILRCASQRDADPVENDGHMWKEKTSWTNMKGEKWGGMSGNAVSNRESLKVFCSALEKTENWRLLPLSLPLMCILQASKCRRFRRSQREAQWIAVELVTAKGVLKSWGNTG